MNTTTQAEQTKLEFQFARREGKRYREYAKTEQQTAATRHASDIWEKRDAARDEGRTAAADRYSIQLEQFGLQSNRWNRLFRRFMDAEGRLLSVANTLKSDDYRLRFYLRSPAEVTKIRRIVGIIRGSDYMMANWAGMAFSLEEVIRKSEEARANLEGAAEKQADPPQSPVLEADPTKVTKPTTISDRKAARGKWMLDECDPSKLTNLELQERVNTEAAKQGWPVYDSDTGNGAFYGFTAAYSKRHGTPYQRDDRGKTK